MISTSSYPRHFYPKQYLKTKHTATFFTSIKHSSYMDNNPPTRICQDTFQIFQAKDNVILSWNQINLPIIISTNGCYITDFSIIYYNIPLQI